jgi:predicted RNA-binding protein
MCLSTAYKNNVDENKVLVKNVASIRVENDEVILVDLMEREFRIKGKLEKVDLLENFVVVKSED